MIPSIGSFYPPQKSSNDYDLFSGSSRGQKVAKETIIVSVLGLQKAGYGKVTRPGERAQKQDGVG